MARTGKLAVAISRANGTYRQKGKSVARKGGHYEYRGEADAAAEAGPAPSSTGETLLIAAAIEECVRVLCKGHPRTWWRGGTETRRFGGTFQQWEVWYWEAVWWMFWECAPERTFSLHWCLEVLSAHLNLNADVDSVRARVRALNIVPEEDIEQCDTSLLACSA